MGSEQLRLLAARMPAATIVDRGPTNGNRVLAPNAEIAVSSGIGGRVDTVCRSRNRLPLFLISFLVNSLAMSPNYLFMWQSYQCYTIETILVGALALPLELELGASSYHWKRPVDSVVAWRWTAIPCV
jgi:hypothetical protein